MHNFLVLFNKEESVKYVQHKEKVQVRKVLNLREAAQALPLTITVASLHLLTGTARWSYNGFYKHLRQWIQKKMKGKRESIFVFWWFERFLYVHLILMQKGAAGEVFTEAQQKNEHCRILRDVANFWCSDLQNKWDTGNKFLIYLEFWNLYGMVI